MANEFRFPSQLWVLMNDEDVPVNLVFVTDFGPYVRRDGEWVEWVIDDNNPMQRFEDMQIAPVDPRILDIWDLGDITEADVEDFEFKWAPPEKGEESPAEPEGDAVTAGAYEFGGGLAAALKRLVADTFVAYQHAHGYHWNVKGPDFAQYHELFSTIYEDYFGAIDPTAENLLKIGESAPYAPADIDAHRSIPDVKPSPDPRDMAEALLAINEALTSSTKAAFDEAANVDNQGIVNFLGDRLDTLDKWSWQLRASIA